VKIVLNGERTKEVDQFKKRRHSSRMMGHIQKDKNESWHGEATFPYPIPDTENLGMFPLD